MMMKKQQSASSQSIDKEDDTDLGGPSNVRYVFNPRNKQEETKVSATNGQPTEINVSKALNDPPTSNKIKSVPKFFKQKSDASNSNTALNKDSSIKNIFRSKSKSSKSVVNVSSKDFENENRSSKKLNKLLSEPSSTGYETSFLKKISLQFFQGLKKKDKQKLGNKFDSITDNEQDPTEYTNSDTSKSKNEDFEDECVVNADDGESGFLRQRKSQMSMRKAFGIFEDYENKDINPLNDDIASENSREVKPEVQPDMCWVGKSATFDDDANNGLGYYSYSYEKHSETNRTASANGTSFIRSKDYWNSIETNGTKILVGSEHAITSTAALSGTSNADDNPDVHSTLKPDAYASQLRQQAKKLSFSKGSGVSFGKKYDRSEGHNAKVKHYKDQSLVGGGLENIPKRDYSTRIAFNTEAKDSNGIDIDESQSLNDTRMSFARERTQVSNQSPSVADLKFKDVVVEQNSFHSPDRFDYYQGQKASAGHYAIKNEKVFEIRDGSCESKSYSNQQCSIYKPDDQQNNSNASRERETQSSVHQVYVEKSNLLVSNNQYPRSASDDQLKRMVIDNDVFESSSSNFHQSLGTMHDKPKEKSRNRELNTSQFSINSEVDSEAGYQRTDRFYNRGLPNCKSFTLDRLADSSMMDDTSNESPMSSGRPSFLCKTFKPVKFFAESSSEEKDRKFVKDCVKSETTNESSKNCEDLITSQTPELNYIEPHTRTKSVGAPAPVYRSPIREGTTNLRSRAKSESRLAFLGKHRHSEMYRSFYEKEAVTKRYVLPKRRKHAEEEDCDDFASMFAKKWMALDSNLSDVMLTKYKTALDYVPSLSCVSYALNEDYSRSLSGDSDKKKLLNDQQQPAKSTKTCFVTLEQAKIDMENKLVKKLDVLNDERCSVERKTGVNDELGGKVLKSLSEYLDEKQVEKFDLLVQEQERVMKLLLKLSKMLVRTEELFSGLPHNSTDKEKAVLHNKTEGLKLRLNEAKQIKENVDNKYEQLLPLFHALLPSNELKHLDTFFVNKCLLMLELEELDNDISLAHQQLQSLRCTMNKNSVGSYC